MALANRNLFELGEKCILLCQELTELFHAERSRLVEFDTEGLQQTNWSKEEKLAELVHTRNQFRDELKRVLEGRELSEVLDQKEMVEWQEHQEVWLRSWNELKSESESNQAFIKHSLKNLDVLSEHLHRLLGIHSVYSPKGTRVESKNEGKVVQGRY